MVEMEDRWLSVGDICAYLGVSNDTGCLQLDVGNSGAKWRLVDAGQVLCRGRYRSDDDASRELLLSCAERVERVLVSSVAAPEIGRAHV